jgi:hypothetical protein
LTKKGTVLNRHPLRVRRTFPTLGLVETMPLTIDQIVQYVQHSFPDVIDDFNWGERALFYNPNRQLPKGIYFLTFKEKDGAHDHASRIGVGEYRLNAGISKRAFVERFGLVPDRPSAGDVISSDHDFTQSDLIMPHPVYGWMCWIAVKNPSAETLETLKPLLAESYQIATGKFNKRVASAARKAAQPIIPPGPYA